MASNQVILKDLNQTIRNRHNHTNRLESWKGLPYQAFSSHVPVLGNQMGVLVVCDCGKEAWVGLNSGQNK